MFNSRSKFPEIRVYTYETVENNIEAHLILLIKHIFLPEDRKSIH